MNKNKIKSRFTLENEFEIIQEFLAGNNAAFDQLILKFKDPVFNLCYRILRNYEDADDCAQETFIKVYKGLKGFQAKAAFSTWLYRIAVNTCKNKLRSAEYRARNKTISIDKPPSTGEGVIYQEIGDMHHSPATVFEKKEELQKLLTSISSLPAGQRVLVALRDLEGRSYEEIAAITGYKLGTVKSRLARARHQLRVKLEEVMKI